MIVWRDGEFTPGETAISAADRGFLIGDAIFETMLVENGVPAFLDEHLQRLEIARAVMNHQATIEPDILRAAIAGLAERNAVAGRAACRLTISRVGGSRGLAPSLDAKSQSIVTLTPIDPPPALLRLIIAKTPRWSAAPTNAFKCAGGYVSNMLARTEAAGRADEAVMLNEHGRVACASAANIFVISGDLVSTPPLGDGPMPGVIRGVLLAEARALGFDVREQPIDPAALRSATLLLTNSLIGVAPGALVDAPAREDDPAAAKIIAACRQRLADALVSTS